MPRRNKNRQPRSGTANAPRRWHQRMVRRLMRLSQTMLTIGEEMDYYGGFGEIGQHGREMITASQLALDWARGMKRDEPWLRKVLADAKREYKKLPKWAKLSNK
jgi:hypothetical protein